MRKSLWEYITALGRWGWAVLVDVFSGIAGAYLDVSGTWGFPTWLWISMLGIAIIVVPFIAFHKLSLKRDELQQELDNIKNARPNIVRLKPEVFLYPIIRNALTGEVSARAWFVRVAFTNDPSTSLQAVDAPDVAGHIYIYGNVIST